MQWQWVLSLYCTGVRVHPRGLSIIPNWSCGFHTNSPPFLIQPPVIIIWLFLALLTVDALLLCIDTTFNLPIHLLAIILVVLTLTNNAIVSIDIQMSEPWLSILLCTLLRDGFAGLHDNPIFNMLWKTAMLCPMVHGVLMGHIYQKGERKVPFFFYFLNDTCYFFSPPSLPFTANSSEAVSCCNFNVCFLENSVWCLVLGWTNSISRHTKIEGSEQPALGF